LMIAWKLPGNVLELRFSKGYARIQATQGLKETHRRLSEPSSYGTRPQPTKPSFVEMGKRLSVYAKSICPFFLFRIFAAAHLLPLFPAGSLPVR
jgi:hypothetical protein